MEFLGDSVLDYLITRYLYEDAKTIYSGKISEIRSALVNNATYASLGVSKCDFHRYINLHSEHLQMLINRYIEVMAHGDRPLNIFGALEDMDITQGIEEVESPKIISDIFESVAGAIYLDSGRKLDEVWRVYSRIMKDIIIEYRKSVPKSPISELLEMFPSKVKYHKTEKLRSNPNVKGEKEKFGITVVVDGKECYKGIGSTEKIAKITAAKLALHQIRQDSKSIYKEMEVSIEGNSTRKGMINNRKFILMKDISTFFSIFTKIFRLFILYEFIIQR